MIEIVEAAVYGLNEAIHGMRNPMNSWGSSDSSFTEDGEYKLGDMDHDLASRLAKAGGPHAKYRRMIQVYVDIKAPLYWWKEFDTYKVGTVANSCSTMHKIHAKEFDIKDFSTEQLLGFKPEWLEADGTVDPTLHPVISLGGNDGFLSPLGVMNTVIRMLNECRVLYLQTKDKRYWWQMIQMLPSSYNQLRTVNLNYEVLANIYKYRKDHKLAEWRIFCKWIETLPYSELITGGEND